MSVNYHHVALALGAAYDDAMHVNSVGVFGAHCDADGQHKSDIWIRSAKQRVLNEIKAAATLLGYELVEKESPKPDTAQSHDILSTAGPHPLPASSPAPQDIFSHDGNTIRTDYSAGLSGRVA